jgi:hypothetical protein
VELRDAQYAAAPLDVAARAPLASRRFPVRNGD